MGKTVLEPVFGFRFSVFGWEVLWFIKWGRHCPPLWR
jgi:hypothetical protein